MGLGVQKLTHHTLRFCLLNLTGTRGSDRLHVRAPQLSEDSDLETKGIMNSWKPARAIQDPCPGHTHSTCTHHVLSITSAARMWSRPPLLTDLGLSAPAKAAGENPAQLCTEPSWLCSSLRIKSKSLPGPPSPFTVISSMVTCHVPLAPAGAHAGKMLPPREPALSVPSA